MDSILLLSDWCIAMQLTVTYCIIYCLCFNIGLTLMWCHLFWFQTCRLLCHISGTEPLEITCIHAEETFRVIGPQVNKREVVCYKSRNLASQLDMLFGKAFRDLHNIDFVNKRTKDCYLPQLVLIFQKSTMLIWHILCSVVNFAALISEKTAEANTLRHISIKYQEIAIKMHLQRTELDGKTKACIEIIFAVQTFFVSLFNTNIN